MAEKMIGMMDYMKEVRDSSQDFTSSMDIDDKNPPIGVLKKKTEGVPVKKRKKRPVLKLNNIGLDEETVEYPENTQEGQFGKEYYTHSNVPATSQSGLETNGLLTTLNKTGFGGMTGAPCKPVKTLQDGLVSDPNNTAPLDPAYKITDSSPQDLTLTKSSYYSSQDEDSETEEVVNSISALDTAGNANTARKILLEEPRTAGEVEGSNIPPSKKKKVKRSHPPEETTRPLPKFDYEEPTEGDWKNAARMKSMVMARFDPRKECNKFVPDSQEFLRCKLGEGKYLLLSKFRQEMYIHVRHIDVEAGGKEKFTRRGVCMPLGVGKTLFCGMGVFKKTLQSATGDPSSLVNYRSHLGRNIFLSIKSKDPYVDIRQFSRETEPLSSPSKDTPLKPTIKGIRLTMTELNNLEKGLQEISRINQPFDAMLPCWMLHTNNSEVKTCSICTPDDLNQ